MKSTILLEKQHPIEKFISLIEDGKNITDTNEIENLVKAKKKEDRIKISANPFLSKEQIGKLLSDRVKLVKIGLLFRDTLTQQIIKEVSKVITFSDALEGHLFFELCSKNGNPKSDIALVEILKATDNITFNSAIFRKLKERKEPISDILIDTLIENRIFNIDPKIARSIKHIPNLTTKQKKRLLRSLLSKDNIADGASDLLIAEPDLLSDKELKEFVTNPKAVAAIITSKNSSKQTIIKAIENMNDKTFIDFFTFKKSLNPHKYDKEVVETYLETLLKIDRLNNLSSTLSFLPETKEPINNDLIYRAISNIINSGYGDTTTTVGYLVSVNGFNPNKLMEIYPVSTINVLAYMAIRKFTPELRDYLINSFKKNGTILIKFIESNKFSGKQFNKEGFTNTLTYEEVKELYNIAQNTSPSRTMFSTIYALMKDEELKKLDLTTLPPERTLDILMAKPRAFTPKELMRIYKSFLVDNKTYLIQGLAHIIMTYSNFNKTLFDTLAERLKLIGNDLDWIYWWLHANTYVNARESEIDPKIKEWIVEKLLEIKDYDEKELLSRFFFANPTIDAMMERYKLNCPTCKEKLKEVFLTKIDLAKYKAIILKRLDLKYFKSLDLLEHEAVNLFFALGDDVIELIPKETREFLLT